ncbi:MAG: hypothetical protein ACR2N6_06845 [Miltoncostaeaceae bacterium]
MLEMVAIRYDGAHAAERALSDMRASRDDAWLSEVGVIEHDRDGRYSVKAKNPDVDKGKAGKGAAIGGLTGLFIGAIGGPFGLLLWGGLGALTGAGIGAAGESAFKLTVEELKAALAPDASMLVLVGETDTLDAFVGASGASGDDLIRRPLTSEQAAELSGA